MYFTVLPDHSKPGFDEQLHFSRFKKQNIIFNAVSANSYCERHVGCLSIKTVLSGDEYYGVNGRQIGVRAGQYLMLNDEQEYSCKIDSPSKTRVVSIFFRREFASTVYHDLCKTDDTLLMNPAGGNSEKQIEFFQTLNPIDVSLRQKMQTLLATLNNSGYHSDDVDEHLLFILQDLIHLNNLELARKVDVQGVKQSTRNEIHRRLRIAKDVMHSNFMSHPSLSDIGREACLSTPQLVRQFKAVYKTTPYQYLASLRLGHAAHLLEQTDMPIHEVTWTCGFQNSSAFCRAFKTKFGASPNVYRSTRQE